MFTWRVSSPESASCGDPTGFGGLASEGVEEGVGDDGGVGVVLFDLVEHVVQAVARQRHVHRIERGDHVGVCDGGCHQRHPRVATHPLPCRPAGSSAADGGGYGWCAGVVDGEFCGGVDAGESGGGRGDVGCGAVGVGVCRGVDACDHRCGRLCDRSFVAGVAVGSKLAVPTTSAGTGFDVAGRAGVDADAVGVALLAVVSNRTATTANVAVVADGTSVPGVSSLNPGPGERTAIAVTSGLASGRVRVVSSQSVDVELFAVGVYVTSITPTLTPATGIGPGVLGFDPLGRLTTTTTGGVTVGYSYLADGTRVAARIQGGGEVYYLGGIEATRTSGVWSQVRRTYPYAGVTIASRTTTPGGTAVSWLLGDRQGSVTTTITAGTATTRWYRPYGGARGPSPVSPVVTTGFLGKHEDPSGLTHLDHRDYDPTTGTFITIDPLVATTGEPYQYAQGNPTTLSDPTGLEPCPKTGCSADDSGGRAPCARSAYSNPMGTGACVPNSASYNAMLKYDEWSACVKWSAGCPTKPSECGAGCGWKILIFVGGAVAQAACGAATIATVGATFGCHALATGATSWGMHAVDGDISINGQDVLAAGAGGLFGVLGRYISRAGSASSKGVDDAVGAFCSFSGKTRVLMADGTTKPISKIEIGDRVLAEDPETGERGPRKVTHLWVHNDTLVDLEVGNAVVSTTEDHPFWNATDTEWQRADVLDVGDQVLSADGRVLLVGGIDLSTAASGSAYNLTVDDIHTYFIQIGDGEALVHNTGCDEFASQFARANGGEVFTIKPPSGLRVFADDAYALGPGEPWFHHTVVVKNGLVFDQFTGPAGMPIDVWKQQWGDLAEEIHFGF